MRSMLVLVTLVVLPITSFGQVWVTRYNGPGNDYDKAECIAIDEVGNIYVTGKSVGSGTYDDYTTIKYNSSGAAQWLARYNGPENLYDEAKAIAIDDNYIYVTGGSMNANLYTDYVTIKYDSSGDSVWAARYSSPGGFDDYAYAVGIDENGNVYATGYSTGSGWDCTTVKYDPSGAQQWAQTFSTNDQDYAIAIAVDGNGSSCIAGSSGDPYFATWDYLTIKYDSSGAEQWVALYNGTADGHDEARAMTLDINSNVIVTGGSVGSGSSWDYTTIKYDPLGDSLWVVRYDGPGNSADWANAIVADDVGNIYVTGGSTGSGLDYDYATVKYSSSGTQQWVARYNGPANGHDEATAIAIDASGNVYVTGFSDGSGSGPDYTTVKYDSLGVEQWVARYDGPGDGDDYARGIAVDDAGYVCITGESEGSGTDYDFATLKYSYAGLEEECTFTETENAIRFRIYPNPFIQRTRISLQLPFQSKVCLEIYDVTGSLVETIIDKATAVGSYTVDFDANGLGDGVYFASLQVTPPAGAQFAPYWKTEKLILVK